jgi:pyruvate dehydrogenase E2 component (dihydrolipoamide acetyltransferase)
MPQMGADMEEGTVVRWLKNEGDAVERGEIIAEIETDKANVEIEAFDGGTFRKALAAEGDTVDVGTVIAIIAAPDDDISQYENGAVKAEAKPSVEATPAAEEPKAEAAPAQAETPAPSPAPSQSEAPATPRAEGRVRASPVARKLAEERGVDLASVAGTGPDGRIVRRDVEAAAAGGAPAQQEARAAAPGPVTPVAMSKMRQTIARRMSQSKREAPHYYITADIDMSEAERIRHQLNDAQDVHVSVNDMLVKASALALAKHPEFNAWNVDGEVQQHGAINVCIAIALDEGLIAPAVLDCGNKSLLDIARASKDLVERAKKGSLKPDEYTGGTFTISNLGAYHVETLIAIIQPPQTAILGVGAVMEKPVVKEGQVGVASLMKVALSADHRVTDGAQGARFLFEIRSLLEKPVALLL